MIKQPVTETVMRRLLRESHAAQFAGQDYQAATFDAFQQFALTDEQLNEIQTAPSPDCECGFCKTAEWE